MDNPWVIVTVGSVAIFFLCFALLGVRTWQRERQLRRARALFPKQREHLEAKFMTAAAASGKPRGLRWKNCEWEREIAFARDRQSGGLAALVAITIQFEAIEGGDMEGLPAVGNLRNASAVFFFDRGRWQTTGKAIFNLNPDEAILHFGKNYERIEAV
jgi:hypothetical protein